MTPEPRGLAVLGATGSVGTTTLEVVDRYPERFRVVGLAAGRPEERFASLVERYRPEIVGLGSRRAAHAFSKRFGPRLRNTRVVGGPEGVEAVACWPGAETVMSAIVGAAGLRPTLAALAAGRVVGLANKESLVAAGPLMAKAAATGGGLLLPVDSEHAAIHQCLAGRREPPRRLWLTASGGPFRTASREAMREATVETTLRHPTWKMGPKITVDSATLMNKGLEMIEARWLFGQEPDAIRVVVHPQSIVHSLVEFDDGSFLAQLGTPHMRVPVQYALTWPERVDTGLEPMSLEAPLSLDFHPPDSERFPCLGLARAALEAGGDAAAVLNAANEVAVEAFLAGRIRFFDIPALVEATLGAHEVGEPTTLDDIVRADGWARDHADSLLPSAEGAVC